MKILSTLIAAIAIGITANAQTTLTDGGFENWGGNASPGVSTEPTGWYSNKSGSVIATAGPQTCFEDSATFHSGHYCAKVETESIFGTAVNGVVTTGVVNAPSITSKAQGYIGTINYSSASDDRRTAFTGRPDSLVGWYQYTPGATTERGKVRAILHTGDYNDPETPVSGNHPDLSANKIGDALFLTDTPGTAVSSWTRFSVPFSYVSTSAPAYIMINITSSNDQNTSTSGSILLIDDLQVVYRDTSHVAVSSVTMKEEDATVYSFGKQVHVNFTNSYDQVSEFTIMDVTGKKVFTQIIQNQQSSVYNVAELTPGIYIYHLSNSNYTKTGKIFIQ